MYKTVQQLVYIRVLVEYALDALHHVLHVMQKHKAVQVVKANSSCRIMNAFLIVEINFIRLIMNAKTVKLNVQLAHQLQFAFLVNPIFIC